MHFKIFSSYRRKSPEAPCHFPTNFKVFSGYISTLPISPYSAHSRIFLSVSEKKYPESRVVKSAGMVCVCMKIEKQSRKLRAIATNKTAFCDL